MGRTHSAPGCLLNRTQIVHFLDGEHGVQFLPAWLKNINRGRAKIVASYHQPVELLKTLIRPELIDKLDHVNLVSPTQTSYFLQFLPPERVSVILHGIDTKFFEPRMQSEERNIFRCITVGHHLRDWQAIAAVADKLKVERDIEFHIVTSHQTSIEEFDNVVIHRNVSDETLLSIYQQSDVLFMPLKDSTANNALLEGIACGLPVVSTKLDSVAAYLPGGEALLVENNDPRQLTDALLKLRGNSDTRLKMGRQARRRAGELSWLTRAQEYEKIYSGLSRKFEEIN
jgi:glycosyltransferase involved in cell wall biosynthesis